MGYNNNKHNATLSVLCYCAVTATKNPTSGHLQHQIAEIVTSERVLDLKLMEKEDSCSKGRDGTGDLIVLALLRCFGLLFPRAEPFCGGLPVSRSPLFLDQAVTRSSFDNYDLKHISNRS